MYPAARYMVSQTELLITGTVTSCRTLGNGPSININGFYFIKLR